MKRKISFLISALCALCACASFTACMTDSQNGNDENTEKARTNNNVVGQQQNEDNGGCPDENCPEKFPEAPDEAMPPMPEFRFMPHHEHMPNQTDGDENGDENGDGQNNENNGEEAPDEDKKPPMPTPHRGGHKKHKMPKKGN